MMLQKKTELGILVASYKQDDEYPGFYIDLRKNEEHKFTPICNIEYEQDKDCVQIVVYGDVNSEEPTDVIEININK